MALKSKERVIRKFVEDCQDARTDPLYVVPSKVVSSSLVPLVYPGRALDIQDGPQTRPERQNQRPTWDNVQHLRWGPEFDDPSWDRAKGLLQAMAFSGFVPSLDANRLIVTETRQPMTDDDRAEIASYECDLIPLIRGLAT